MMVFYIFIQISIEYSVSKYFGEPDQMPHSVASDLGLHCSSMSHKKDARLIWVNYACKLMFHAFVAVS